MKDNYIIKIGLIIVFLNGVQYSGYSQEVIDSLVGNQINIAKNINQEIRAEALNYHVNSIYKELKPLVSPNGKMLYFSRQYHPENVGGVDDPEDIWVCEFNEKTQQWQNATNIGPPLNTEGPNFVSGIGKFGDTLLLGNVYTNKGKLRAGVSVSVKLNDSWSTPRQIHIDSDYNMAQRSSYDVTSDRQAILIAEQKDDSYGGLDLYVAFRKGGGKYTYSGTEAINLGPVINTYQDETSPFLADDNKTLYFCSDGHYGMGKMDVFVSKRLDDTWQNWSQPENLGPAVNTRFDDLFFNFSPLNQFAYYSRGITPDNVDIYRVDMTRLFKNVETKMLKRGKLDMPVSVGQTIRLRDAFNPESPVIRSAAKEELANISEFLTANPQVEILIITHAQKQITRQESQLISQKRALAVTEQLELSGIDRERLHSAPKGHDVVVNTSNPYELNHLHNMIEIRFIKM